MKVYYSKQSLIFKGFTRYWREHDPFNKWFLYGENKKLKRDNPIGFKNRNRYNALEDNDPLCYYGKCKVAPPRKFLLTLKRLNLLSLGIMYEKQLREMIECTYMHKKMCSDYYLPIFELGE